MIEIINEKGIALELSANFSLTIERENPLFQKNDEFFQDITYPGKAPLTDNNKMFISSGHLVEASIYKYELPVILMIDGTALFSGNMAYEIHSDQISFVLKTGYAAIAEICEKKMLFGVDYGPEISTAWENKNDSLDNPNNWPFAYFHTYHQTQNVESYDHQSENINYISNRYDIAGQKLYEWQESDPTPRREIAHWKLVFVLEKVIESLGFKAAGTFFTSPEITSLYIYNLQAATEIHSSTNITRAENGVPDMTIADFLKALKSRFRITIVFDMIQKIARIDEPNSLLKSTDYIDISDYISSIDKIVTPDRLSYKIEAKLNENEYNPPNHIIVTDPTSPTPLAEDVIEMEISTLPLAEDEAYQISYPITKKPYLTGRAIGPTPEPPERERRWSPPYDSERHATLQLMRFPGLTLSPLGQNFPTAYPVDFSLDDGEWFAFLNDSKQVTLKALIPNHMLSGIDLSKKIGFISKENLFVTGVVKKMDYTLSNSTRDLIEVAIEVHSYIERKTTVELVENQLTNDPNTRPRRPWSR